MYRVDRRLFYYNDIITPDPVSYQDRANFNSERREIERVVELNRPPNIEECRRHQLFVFFELSDALRFSTRMIDAKVYKVIPMANARIFHTGDMNWMDLMLQFSRLGFGKNELAAMARFYWQNAITPKPIYESIVNCMQVEDVIFVNEAQRLNFSNDLRVAGGNIERVPMYADILKHYNSD